MTPRRLTSIRQHGGALLVLLIILVVGGAYLFVSALNKAGQKISNDQATATALAQAKEALIGYAVKHNTTPGIFPCTASTMLPANEGVANVSCSGGSTVDVGRLPWKTLKLPDVRDGANECLWYAVSKTYTQQPINTGTVGAAIVYDANGTALPSPTNPVIAVIIAPGAPLSGQNRTNPINGTLCGSNTTASNFLDRDTASGINNALGPNFIAVNESSTFNDKLIFVTRDQVMPLISRRAATEIKAALVSYYNAHGSQLPWADTNSDGYQNTSSISGNIPYKDIGLYPSWEASNNWFTGGMTTYTVASPPTSGQVCAGQAPYTTCLSVP